MHSHICTHSVPTFLTKRYTEEESIYTAVAWNNCTSKCRHNFWLQVLYRIYGSTTNHVHDLYYEPLGIINNLDFSLALGTPFFCKSCKLLYCQLHAVSFRLKNAVSVLLFSLWLPFRAYTCIDNLAIIFTQFISILVSIA